MSESDQVRPAATADRFRCVLTPAGEPECTTYARVTITDASRDSARACPRHAVAALDGIDGAPGRALAGMSAGGVMVPVVAAHARPLPS
jgi:hypothetical protein